MTEWQLFALALSANILGQIVGGGAVLFGFFLVREIRRRWNEARDHEGSF